MTLKEKFIKTYRKVFSVENLAEECIKITDEFAIGFAQFKLTHKRFQIFIQKYCQFKDLKYTDGNSNGMKWFIVGEEGNEEEVMF